MSDLEKRAAEYAKQATHCGLYTVGTGTVEDAWLAGYRAAIEGAARTLGVMSAKYMTEMPNPSFAFADLCEEAEVAIRKLGDA